MKTNIIKLSLLSLILLISWFILVWTNAAPQNVNVSLQISWWNQLACTNTWVTLNGLNFSLNAQTQTGVFAPNSRYCTDERWTAWSSNLTVVSSTLNGPWQAIPAAHVKMTETAPAASAWNITATSTISPTVPTSLDSTQSIFQKTVATSVGTIRTTPTLYVTTNTNQAPWMYTWLITVSNPSNI